MVKVVLRSDLKAYIVDTVRMSGQYRCGSLLEGPAETLTRAPAQVLDQALYQFLVQPCRPPHHYTGDTGYTEAQKVDDELVEMVLEQQLGHQKIQLQVEMFELVQSLLVLA